MIGRFSDEEKDYLLSLLPQFITDSRMKRIHEVLAQRTTHLTLVLEDIFQSHNAAAIIRTAESYGLQEVHVLENRNEFHPADRITRGSEKWIDVQHYDTSVFGVAGALNMIKNKGYQLVATSPGKASVSIEELDITKPTALIFGSERPGVGNEVLQCADTTAYIPMRGFTESFNVSVSAGIALYSLIRRLPKALTTVSEAKKRELLLDWYMKSVRHPEQLIPGLLSKRKS
jgi:tRNA (guanosine-2'-O-)-methyltransferase